MLDRYDAVVERVAAASSTVVLIGGLDSGKTTLAHALSARALSNGRTVAYVDADLGQKTIGPPTAVTLRMLRAPEELPVPPAAAGTSRPLRDADRMYFVGSTSPQGHLLPLVVGVARMAACGRDEGADLVVVDTSGLVSGMYAQILKYHKVELLEPDVVIGLHRGEELDPLLGVIQRFFAAEVLAVPVPPDTRATSAEERAQRRQAAFRAYFTEPIHRWRVKPSVFMPALPALFEQRDLDRLMVGLSDGSGDHSGLGYLSYSADDDVIRLISPVGEAPKALKLGALRLEEDFRVTRVDLRRLFGSD